MGFAGKKVALVTGASGAIGGAIARRLANDGMCVAVCYNSGENAANTLCKSIVQGGGVAEPFLADISDSKQVSAMVLAVGDRFGDIDILINNAGIAQQILFTDITDEQWDKMIATNLSGAFYCTRAVLPQMLRNHSGVIINISSIWGISGASCEVHYSAAKAGLIGMTKALAKEVGPSGIRVNCVAPGVIASPMTDCLGEETMSALRDETPLGEIGTPEDVAHCVGFLCTDGAKFITGQVISPNGGIM
ncbi:MAG: 3-oxoacyl-ACP reductase FabG [Oscillospiraceae bacterium]|jgi:3-oxoacyl-[acyl-carrier protein] reductase|nr:3-oxoacyl-ACP reductase FabG [Oscillospiraceae bacterium]